ncbi:helix-turn-helix protein [Dysgonomonas alginatilytica]|uniref:Helix-turn-helix protein n=1 Tax=Dysgonomonas alginatilytica TaxID=1605892 RepID=A0A2V3PM00_9BACT|nr:helix-turn-helix transcriptional regulator [Dysgonomonas alginatilytica]PXV62386.1 helix-turn-helix protein [Dysgonomonas alginatilytica]
METDVIGTKPHHGFNVMIKRKRRHMSQDALGEKLGMFQGQVSMLESQETIEDETLEKIAEVLECPISELRDFDIDKAMNANSVINSNNTNNDSANSYSGINQTINNISPEIIELYKTILQEEKDLRIREVQAKDAEILYLRKLLEESLKK